MRRVAVLVAAALALAEADPALAAIPSSLVRMHEMPPINAETAPGYLLRRFDEPSEGAEVAYALLANVTRLIKAAGFPLQVAYTAGDGGLVLWFPRSGELHRGRWWIEEQRWPLVAGGVTIRVRSKATVCFDYGSAVSAIPAPEWQRGGGCLPLWFLRKTRRDRREGDMLGLTRGGPPAAVGRRDVRSLADLLRQPSERAPRDER